MNIRAYIFFCIAMLISFAAPVRAQGADVRIVGHLVKERSSISSILYSYGIGTPGSPFRLYGPAGWLNKTKKLNPEVTDWDKLPAGKYLRLAVPAKQISRPVSKPAARPAPVVKKTPPPPPPPAFPPPAYIKPAPEDLTPVDVTAVKQAVTFGTMAMRMTGGSELKEPLLSMENVVRLGRYLSGDVVVSVSGKKNKFVSGKEDADPVPVDYKGLTVSGRILIPTSSATWHLRGAILKTGINTPLKGGFEGEASAYSPDPSPAPAAGLGVSEKSGSRLLWEVNVFGTKWNGLDYFRATASMTYRVLPTWYIGPTFFQEQLHYLPDTYENVAITYAGLTFGFGMSQ